MNGAESTTARTGKSRRGLASPRRWRRPRLVVPAVAVAVWVVAVIVVPPLMSYSATESSTGDRLEAPSAAHWLGTDDFGRDILVRLLMGGRTSLEVGLTVTVVAAVLGTAIGICAGYLKGVRGLLMRINDGVMAFPAVMLAIGVIAVIGAGQWQTAAVLAVVYAPLFVRVAYGETLSLSRRKFIESAALAGVSRPMIMFRHILPNLTSAIVVQATYVFATSMLLEASLSFLGAGVQEPTPSLGGMINGGYQLIDIAWWMVAFPGIALAILVLAVSLLGDALSDMLGRNNSGVSE